MIGEQLKAILGELIALVVVGLVAYVYLKKDAQTYLPSTAQVATSLKDIVTQGPSTLVAALKGQNDSTYITQAQANARAQANLARVLAARGALVN